MENNAVDTLLISDKLFRAKNLVTRRAYVQLVEKAEKHGISTMIFSSMNPSGERLDNLSGVAALLRYALPGIDDIEEDDIDIDDLINQEGASEERKSEEDPKEAAKAKQTLPGMTGWDQEQLYKLLEDVGDEIGGEEDEE